MHDLTNSEENNNDIKVTDKDTSNNSKCELFKGKENVSIKKNNNLKNFKEFMRNNRTYVYEYVDNFNNDNSCSMDIGGTLIKIVYENDNYIYDKNEYKCNEHLAIKIGVNKYIFFKFFKIQELEEALDFIIKNGIIKKKITLTGGGSHKYYYILIEKILLYKITEEKNFINSEHKLQILKQYYCEKSSTLHVEVCLNKSANDENLFIKKNLDKTKYKTIKIYLLKSNNKEICNIETDQCLQKDVNNHITSNYNARSSDNIKSNTNNRDENIIFNGKLILECSRKDEMKSIINGIHVLCNIQNSIVRYDFLFKIQVPVKVKSPLHPFLIANIGSGISILKSDGLGNYKRIGGTAVGGGTFMGLAHMIFGEITFEELIKLAEKGTSKLDLKVKNLRGDASGSSCLSKEALASFFGFLSNIKKKRNYKNDEFKQDVAKSLISMVSYNLGYLVYTFAKIHKVQRIFFSGNYISNCEYIMESLTYGVYYYYLHYHSKINKSDSSVTEKSVKSVLNSTYEKKKDLLGNLYYSNKYSYNCPCDCDITNKEMNDDFLPEILFLKHDGFLCAIGCFFS